MILTFRISGGGPMNARELNRRHKAGLFLTLILAGIFSLTGGVGAGVGVLLLGVAMSWLFGSNSRIVHVGFLIVGALCAMGLVADGLYVHHQQVASYRQVMRNEDEFRNFGPPVPLKSVQPATPQSKTDSDNVTVQAPNGKLFDLPRNQLPRALQQGFRLYQPTPPRPFSLKDALLTGPSLLIFMTGMALSLLGIGLLVGVRPAPPHG